MALSAALDKCGSRKEFETIQACLRDCVFQTFIQTFLEALSAVVLPVNSPILLDALYDTASVGKHEFLQRSSHHFPCYQVSFYEAPDAAVAVSFPSGLSDGCACHDSNSSIPGLHL